MLLLYKFDYNACEMNATSFILHFVHLQYTVYVVCAYAASYFPNKQHTTTNK